MCLASPEPPVELCETPSACRSSVAQSHRPRHHDIRPCQIRIYGPRDPVRDLPPRSSCWIWVHDRFWVFACSLILLAAVALADVEVGDRAYGSGAFSQAIAAYRESVERDPTDVEARYRLARAISTLADTLDESEARAGYIEAAEHARAAIAIDPEVPEAHVELARALGRFAELTGPLRALDLAKEVRRRLEVALELVMLYLTNQMPKSSSFLRQSLLLPLLSSSHDPFESGIKQIFVLIAP